MSEREFREALFQWKIPKKVRILVAKEMELLGLLRRKGDVVELIEPRFNEDDCNIYFKKLKIF